MNGPDECVAGAILLSALVGAIIALAVAAQQRISAKKKNAYDMVLTLFQPDLADCVDGRHRAATGYAPYRRTPPAYSAAWPMRSSGISFSIEKIFSTLT